MQEEQYENCSEDYQKLKLLQICKDFIDENDIGHAETIYQSDRVIENAYDFIADICDIVGYKVLDDEEYEEE